MIIIISHIIRHASCRDRRTFDKLEVTMIKLIQKVLLNMCPPECTQDPQECGRDRNTVCY